MTASGRDIKPFCQKAGKAQMAPRSRFTSQWKCEELPLNEKVQAPRQDCACRNWKGCALGPTFVLLPVALVWISEQGHL